RVEGERTVNGNHDLAIENEFFWLELTNSFGQFRKISCHRTASLGLEIDALAIAKGQTPKAVPLRLILPVGANRYLVDGKGLHGAVRKRNGKGHEASKTTPLREHLGGAELPTSKSTCGQSLGSLHACVGNQLPCRIIFAIETELRSRNEPRLPDR